MLSKLMKHKVQFFSILLSFIACVYFINLIVKYPKIGIKVNDDSGQYVINDILNYSWAGKRDFQLGDIIERIDGKSPEEHSTVQSYDSVEQAKNIIINRNGTIKEYNIQYTPYSKQLLYHLLIPVGFYVICLFMAMYLLLFVPEINHSKKNLLYFLTALGISFISIMATQRKDTFAFVVASISLVSSFSFFVRFMKLYFKMNQIKFLNKKQLILADVISVILIIVNIFVYTNYHDFAELFTMYLGVSLFLLTGYLLLRFRLKNKYSNHLKFMRIILMSFLISAVPFVCLFLIPNMLDGKEVISAETTGIFFLFIPMCIFYLVIAGKGFDSKFIIQRLQYYTVLSVGLNFYFSVLGLVVFDDREDLVLDTVKFSVVATISTILFLFIKDYVDLKFRKSLYHHQKNYQFSLSRFLHQAKNEYKLSNLIFSIQREISDVLKMEDTCCIELNKQDKTIHLLDNKHFPKTALEQLMDFQLETYKVGSIVKLEGYFGLVLSTTTEKIIILLCNAKGKENLNLDEIVWIETLCNYTDLLLECSNQIEDLLKQLQDLNDIEQPPMWLAKLLFKLSEKERANLASDIHDGVLQDQLRLSRKFESYNKRIKDEEMKSVLHEIQEELLDHIYTIRETCNNLRPPFLYELGLKKALINLFKQINLKATFFFYYDIPEHIIVPSTEHEQAVYRIVQELLNNALKHSQASNVTIKLFQKGNHLYLTYVDNGIGLEFEQFNYSYNTLGLSGIVTRIQSLGGEISIESNPNLGLHIVIKF
ncbi:sensor histidine kinase [Bacillus pretiosus]|uniref:sensor histidine kinase n=1 Tax=Bacillus TaxID=1386 RepID=UPI003D64F04B